MSIGSVVHFPAAVQMDPFLHKMNLSITIRTSLTIRLGQLKHDSFGRMAFI